MHAREVSPDRTLLVEFAYDESLRSELRAFADAAEIESAWVLGTGALRSAELAVYDQDDLESRLVSYDEPLEMPLFTGTVTTGDTPDVQLQAVLARPSGQALAGRLDSATVFFGQALVWTFEESLDRERDPDTGMDRLAL
ncbi:MAG: PPC domain-containing DNA-binding protein [Halodesulfurarchaeum sp.]|nr:PPC domain-containing DNA-binding protein [Halodesulfurarchaeum sp.]